MSILSFTMVSCGVTEEKNPLIGTWYAEQNKISITLVFNADGTMTYTRMREDVVDFEADGTYVAENWILNATLYYEGDDGIETNDKMFKDTAYMIEGDTLTMVSDDETAVLTRK